MFNRVMAWNLAIGILGLIGGCTSHQSGQWYFAAAQVPSPETAEEPVKLRYTE